MNKQSVKQKLVYGLDVLHKVAYAVILFTLIKACAQLD